MLPKIQNGFLFVNDTQATEIELSKKKRKKLQKVTHTKKNKILLLSCVKVEVQYSQPQTPSQYSHSDFLKKKKTK